METKTTPVILFLADITGYTRFMLSHQKATVHSQMIVGGLMETLMQQIDRPLRIVELEGDALFLYAAKTIDAESWEKRSRHLVDRVLRLFTVFDRRKAELAAYSVCRCPACANLMDLRLKVVAHSGEALLNRVGHFSVLSGVDVITVHRLLKNSVNAGQYLLMTESAHGDLRLPPGAAVVEGTEAYDIGTVQTYFYVPEPEQLDESSVRATFAEDNVAVKILRHEIREEYTEVAANPSRGFHFNTGRAAARATEYDQAWLDGIPSDVIESFAGTGNPFSLGTIEAGEHVVDVGSGAGLDALIAGRMVGPDGHVIGVEMTPAMLEKARAGAAMSGSEHVEFRERPRDARCQLYGVQA